MGSHRAFADRFQIHAMAKKQTASKNIVSDTMVFLNGAPRMSEESNIGGTLWPNRLNNGRNPRTQADTPKASRKAGITILSVLKIQPHRSVI